MDVPIRYLDAQQLQPLVAGVLESLPGPLLGRFIGFEPPVAVVEIDRPSQPRAAVASAGVPDGAVDEDRVPGRGVDRRLVRKRPRRLWWAAIPKCEP